MLTLAFSTLSAQPHAELPACLQTRVLFESIFGLTWQLTVSYSFMLLVSVWHLYNFSQAPSFSNSVCGSTSDIFSHVHVYLHFQIRICAHKSVPIRRQYPPMLVCLSVCVIGGDSGMDLSHSMRHSSKNAIPTKPQKQPADRKSVV